MDLHCKAASACKPASLDVSVTIMAPKDPKVRCNHCCKVSIGGCTRTRGHLLANPKSGRRHHAAADIGGRGSGGMPNRGRGRAVDLSPFPIWRGR